MTTLWERRSSVSRVKYTRLGDSNHPHEEGTGTFPDSSVLKTKEPAADGLSVRYITASSLLCVPDWKQPGAFPEVEAAEGGKAGEVWSAGGNTAVELGASGCPPSPPIPGRATSLAPPSNSVDGILAPGAGLSGQNSPQPAGLRLPRPQPLPGAGPAKSARPVRGPVREPLPDSARLHLLCR